jgi:DNA (cytosine-5)-methyltransferase 1
MITEMITVATDCSGIDAPIEALKQLGVSFKQLWYCDNNKYARETSEANHPKPEIFFDDMLSRNNKSLPHLDLYICGFPCQSFSLAGKRLGTSDPRSGIIPKMMETIHYSRPKICILENVRGFMNIEKGVPCKKLMDFLSNEGYSTDCSLYNTKYYGIPQNRERMYIVAIRKDIKIKDYKKPEHLPMKPFDDLILDKKIHKEEIPSIYKKNLHKLKPFTKVISAKNYYSPMEHVSNTLDTTCRYLYIVKYNRAITIEEALSLQGFPRKFNICVSTTQIMKQIGNTMSVNVLKEIMKEALKCV